MVSFGTKKVLQLHFIKVHIEIPCWELTYHTYGRGKSSFQHVVNPHSKVAMDGMGKGGDALECRFLHESLQEGGEVWVRLRLEIVTRSICP